MSVARSDRRPRGALSRVLVVDDEPDIRELIDLTLSRMGLAAACVGTVWLWMTGLKVIPASQAGVFTVMLPVGTALTGVLALGETLNPVQGLALAIALLGVLMATLPGRPQALPPASS